VDGIAAEVKVPVGACSVIVIGSPSGSEALMFPDAAGLSVVSGVPLPSGIPLGTRPSSETFTDESAAAGGSF
jgi:hypothetical protein